MGQFLENSPVVDSMPWISSDLLLSSTTGVEVSMVIAVTLVAGVFPVDTTKI